MVNQLFTRKGECNEAEVWGGEEGRSGTKEMESDRNKLAKKEISYRKGT
jgi:hypothetical protein